MARTTRKPFEVSLSEQDETDLTHWLCVELQAAIDARAKLAAPDQDIDYWHSLYEQGSGRASHPGPWPNAADLTSYIITEKVDSLRARMVKTVFVEPLWTVEGRGEAADRAPYVEEFHQWAQEAGRLQGYCVRAFHNALIETVGVLEAREQTERRWNRRERTLQVETAEDGSVVLDESNRPKPKRDADGNFLDATDPNQPQAKVVVKSFDFVGKGPEHRVIAVKDFLQLPGHAEDRKDVWGYAKRFWRRVPQLQERQKEGIYRNVDRLGEDGERLNTTQNIDLGLTVAEQKGPTAEKELWEVYFLRDLEGEGEQWYVATVSLNKRVMLRLQHDDLGRSRFVLFIPFPRPNSVWGYSYAGHKLLTIQEEHTALRNMIADRGALKTNAPLTRVQGALWDPREQPFGPNAVIDVRDHNEVKPFDLPDVPASMIDQRRHIEAASERVSGQNDVSMGVTPEQKRTLGEVQMVTEQSFVRIDEAIKNMQEGMEDLGELENLLWIRTLEREENGMEMPAQVVGNLAAQGLQDDRVTADMLRGNFRFKPRGSVETADPSRLRADFNQFIQAIGALAKGAPMLGQWMSDPERVRAIFAEAVRLYRFQNPQKLLGTQEEWQQFVQRITQPPMVPGMPPGVPGMNPTPGQPGPSAVPPQLLAMLNSPPPGVPN